MGKMLFVLNTPEMLPIVGEPGKFYKFDKEGEANKWCLLMLSLSFLALLTGFFKRLSFGLVGESVTYRVRLNLFKKMLAMSKGWFDHNEAS